MKESTGDIIYDSNRCKTDKTKQCKCYYQCKQLQD